MRIPHIYQPSSLALDTPVSLDDDAAGHISRVLRMNEGDLVSLFNGEGGEYVSRITEVSKKKVIVTPFEFKDNDLESPLRIHLGQGISRGDKMEFTIQKAVELGVSEITPLFTERCGVKLTGDRLTKKWQQWQKIAISACEQSGRNTVPVVHQPMQVNDWLSTETNELKLSLHPRAEHSIKTLPAPTQGLRFVIGPEGGFTDDELAKAKAHDFINVRLGPRVLRTETTALTVLSALQLQFGDLG